MDNLDTLAQTIRAPIVLPLVLSLSTEATGGGGAELRLGKGGQSLAVDVSNALDTPLRLAPLDWEGGGYHLRLSFRPKMLSAPKAVTLSPESAAAGWRLRADKAATGGRQAFHLALPAGRALAPGDGVSIGFENLAPDAGLGARQTELSVNYDNLLRGENEVLRGHMLARLTLTELGEEAVPLRWARSGSTGISKLLSARPTYGYLKKQGKTSIPITITNISGRDLPIGKVGTDDAPCIRIPHYNENFPALNNFGDAIRLKLVSHTPAFWSLSEDGRSLTPIKEFVWPAKSGAGKGLGPKFEVDLEVGTSDIGNNVFPLVMNYENFGESGVEAGEMILQFESTNVYQRNRDVFLLDRSLTFGDEGDAGGKLTADPKHLSVYAPGTLQLVGRDDVHVKFGKQAGFGGDSLENAPLKITNSNDLEIKGSVTATDVRALGSLRVGRDHVRRPFSATVDKNNYGYLQVGYGRFLEATASRFNIGGDDPVGELEQGSDLDVRFTSKNNMELFAGRHLHISARDVIYMGGTKIEDAPLKISADAKNNWQVTLGGTLTADAIGAETLKVKKEIVADTIRVRNIIFEEKTGSLHHELYLRLATQKETQEAGLPEDGGSINALWQWYAYMGGRLTKAKAYRAYIVNLYENKRKDLGRIGGKFPKE